MANIPIRFRVLRLKNSSGKTVASGLSGFKNRFRVHVRSVFKRVFHCLLNGLGFRRLREHSFFAPLLARPAAVMDFGAHRGEFFAALKSEHPVSRALLIEADPALAESLKQTFGDEATLFMLRPLQKANKTPSRLRDRSSLSLQAFSRNGQRLTA